MREEGLALARAEFAVNVSAGVSAPESLDQVTASGSPEGVTGLWAVIRWFLGWLLAGCPRGVWSRRRANLIWTLSLLTGGMKLLRPLPGRATEWLVLSLWPFQRPVMWVPRCRRRWGYRKIRGWLAEASMMGVLGLWTLRRVWNPPLPAGGIWGPGAVIEGADGPAAGGAEEPGAVEDAGFGDDGEGLLSDEVTQILQLVGGSVEVGLPGTGVIVLEEGGGETVELGEVLHSLGDDHPLDVGLYEESGERPVRFGRRRK